jgi:hypothetical protein
MELFDAQADTGHAVQGRLMCNVVGAGRAANLAPADLARGQISELCERIAPPAARVFVPYRKLIPSAVSLESASDGPLGSLCCKSSVSSGLRDTRQGA